MTPFRVTCNACLWSELRAFVDDRPVAIGPCRECAGREFTLQLRKAEKGRRNVDASDIADIDPATNAHRSPLCSAIFAPTEPGEGQT